MNLPFQRVIKSPINNSKSKQSHLFSRSLRFNKIKQSYCLQDSYQLSKLDMTSNIKQKQYNIPQSPRFKQRFKTQTPSPLHYRHKSFLQKNQKLGSTFNQQKRITFLDKRIIPGPGAYDPKINKSTPLISMSPQLYRKRRSIDLGPGQYQCEKYQSIGNKNKIISKFKTVSVIKIGTQKRFKLQNKDIQRFPSPLTYSIEKQKNKLNSSYSFGTQKKKYVKLQPNFVPGPGSYDPFSQFSERQKKIQMNLNKIQSLVKGNKK